MIDLFGASASKFANKFTSYSIDSSPFIDMTAKGDDGQFWDLGTRGPREIGTIAAITSNRTPDRKRTMHVLSDTTAPQRERNERAN